MKKLFDGPHEIRLSDDENLTTLGNSIANSIHGDAGNRVLVVNDHRGTTWRLLVTNGVPLAITDRDTTDPPTPPVTVFSM